ncbi:MAG: PilZ domain-containing protein [Desulfomonile tiedjei]|nr:PilZ domain-containing protein [Desulfomonile tiedjei]
MRPKPRLQISVKDFLADVRTGMTDAELMEKYGLSARGLTRTFEKLTAGGFVSPAEVERRTAHAEDTVRIDVHEISLEPREELSCLVPIYELGVPEQNGLVCAISEQELKVTGIETEVGETKRLVISADLFFALEPLTFEARCVSVKPKTSDDETVYGLRITDISEAHREMLKKLIHLATA